MGHYFKGRNISSEIHKIDDTRKITSLTFIFPSFFERRMMIILPSLLFRIVRYANEYEIASQPMCTYIRWSLLFLVSQFYLSL